MQPEKFGQLLAQAKPLTPEGADLILDLRELLLNGGHPGTCVQCFFALLGNLERPSALSPLRHWLEKSLEVAVSINGETRETLPVSLSGSRNLVDYCEQVTDLIRNDRSYSENQIELTFRYRSDSPTRLASA